MRHPALRMATTSFIEVASRSDGSAVLEGRLRGITELSESVSGSPVDLSNILEDT